MTPLEQLHEQFYQRRKRNKHAPVQKRVECHAHGMIAAGPKYLVPWEDVWLRWKGKPGQTRYRAAPCLLCAAEILRDHRAGDATDVSRQLLADVERDGYAAAGSGAGLNIVTPAKGMDRAEAERMLTWWLHREHGLTNVKFVWKKPEIVAAAMGFGNYGA